MTTQFESTAGESSVMEQVNQSGNSENRNYSYVCTNSSVRWKYIFLHDMLESLMLCTHHCFRLDVPNIVTRAWMMLCVNSTDSSDDNLMPSYTDCRHFSVHLSYVQLLKQTIAQVIQSICTILNISIRSI